MMNEAASETPQDAREQERPVPDLLAALQRSVDRARAADKKRADARDEAPHA